MTAQERSVYFIVTEDETLVKVGSALDPVKRLKQIQTSCPDRLRLYGVAVGGFRGEQALHALFHAYRVRGEWFRLHPIRESVDKVCCGQDPLEEDELWSVAA